MSYKPWDLMRLHHVTEKLRWPSHCNSTWGLDCQIPKRLRNGAWAAKRVCSGNILSIIFKQIKFWANSLFL